MKKSADFIYVGIQFLLLTIFVIFPGDYALHTTQKIWGWIGNTLILMGILTAVIALLQLNTNLTPFPTPRANGSLVTGGIYRIVRHPIYFSILLLGTGGTLITDSLYRLVITVLLLLLFHFKSRYEEQMLTEKYPEYATYQKKTGRLFPKFW